MWTDLTPSSHNRLWEHFNTLGGFINNILARLDGVDRYTATEQVVVGSAPPAGAPKQVVEGVFEYTTTTYGGGVSVNFPAFAGITFVSYTPITQSHRLTTWSLSGSNLFLSATQLNGDFVPVGTPVKVAYRVEGWRA